MLTSIFKNYPNDFDVTGIDNLNNSCSTLNKEMFSDKNFTHIDLNINEINQLENKDYDMIINFAAESHVDNSISSPREFLKVNIEGTFNLLEISRDLLFNSKFHSDEISHNEKR